MVQERECRRQDPRVDAYITKAQPFAQPILIHIRKVVHAAVPDVQETMKWSSPHFDYKGIFCGMAAFKEHVGFGFWKAGLMKDLLPGSGLSAAGPVRQDRVAEGSAQRQGADAHHQVREEAQ